MRQKPIEQALFGEWMNPCEIINANVFFATKITALFGVGKDCKIAAKGFAHALQNVRNELWMSFELLNIHTGLETLVPGPIYIYIYVYLFFSYIYIYIYIYVYNCFLFSSLSLYIYIYVYDYLPIVPYIWSFDLFFQISSQPLRTYFATSSWNLVVMPSLALSCRTCLRASVCWEGVAKEFRRSCDGVANESRMSKYILKWGRHGRIYIIYIYT